MKLVKRGTFQTPRNVALAAAEVARRGVGANDALHGSHADGENTAYVYGVHGDCTGLASVWCWRPCWPGCTQPVIHGHQRTISLTPDEMRSLNGNGIVIQ